MTQPIELLLAAHATTSLRDTNGWTPIDAAIHAQQSDAIRLLLPSSPSHPERAVSQTIHQAAEEGNLDELAVLLDTATNLEVRNELGVTPLQLAVLHGHLAAAAMLVDHGADIDARDPQGNTMLHQILLQERFLNIYDRPPTNWLARVGEDPDKERYLKFLTVGQNEQGPNPLLQAASFLLASGIDVAATNNSGQTAAQLLTEDKMGRYVFFFNDDRSELLQLLTAHGATVDARDADGNTALHLAGQDTSVDRVASLVAAGADVNATNNQGQTPLHKFAVRIWNWDESGANPPNAPFQFLVAAKANVNAQDNDGLTPLDILAMSDTSFKTEATSLLLQVGANPNLRDKHGRTAMDFFLSGQWPWDSAGDCIQLLVKAGADLSVKDDKGKTSLHYLASLGSQDSMFFIRGIGDVFLNGKVDINSRDDDGDTPAHLAARSGAGDVYHWLARHGADLDATNNMGETPRSLATRTAATNLLFNMPSGQ